MLGAIVAPGCVTKLGVKRSLIVGALMTSAVVFCQVLPAWKASMKDEDPQSHGAFWNFLFDRNTNIVILIAGNMIGGLAQALLWTA